MKALKTVVLGILLFTISNSQAQVSVNINFGTPPVWAPADRVEVQYYYLPDVDAYYDVPTEQFIYINNGVWIRSRALPSRYSNYNLRSGRVVYITDYRGKSPYNYHKKHKVKYHTTYVTENRNVVVVKRKGNNERGHGNEKGHGKGHGKGKGKRD